MSKILLSIAQSCVSYRLGDFRFVITKYNLHVPLVGGGGAGPLGVGQKPGVQYCASPYSWDIRSLKYIKVLKCYTQEAEQS